MIDKDAFLKASTPEETISLPGVGEVRVRGLTRNEALSLSQLKADPRSLECLIVRLGVVEPALTADEVNGWYDSAASGLTDIIVNAVTRLSALDEGAHKSGVPGVREGQ